MAPITETHREEARRIVGSISFLLPDAEVWRSRVEATIATALAAAEQRGWDKALEEAAKVAEERIGIDRRLVRSGEVPADEALVAIETGKGILQGIRSLKTNTIAQRAAEGGGEQNETTAALDNLESNHTGGQAIAEARREMGG